MQNLVQFCRCFTQIAFIWNFLTSSLCVLHAGVWASKLGAMAGVKVPLIAMHHAYVVTERIEGIQVGPPSVLSEQLDCGS